MFDKLKLKNLGPLSLNTKLANIHADLRSIEFPKEYVKKITINQKKSFKDYPNKRF